MAKVRTIPQAYAYIKEQDKDTALTQHGFRQMVVSGKVPSCRSGNKYLVDIDKLDSFLTGECIQSETLSSTEYGKIRAVSE